MLRLLIVFLFFLVQSFVCLAAPPDCNAPFLNINETFAGTFDQSSNTGLPKPPCGIHLGFDRFYRFIATGPTMTINITGNKCDPDFMVYGGKCPNSLVSLGCTPTRRCGLNKDPALTYYNLIPGEIYFLRVWSQTIPALFGHYFTIVVSDETLENFSGTSGSAQMGSPNDCVDLTNSTDQTGCAFYGQMAANNISRFPNLDLTFTMNFGNAGANSKNGMCFVLTTSQIQCGSGGYGIGAEGIPNSLIVEFDTWDDGIALTPDIPEDHITIFMNGDFTTPLAGPFSIPSIPEFADGADHTFHFTWNPNSYRVTVTFDNNPVVDFTPPDLIIACFEGYAIDPNKRLRFGFTSSTDDVAVNNSVCYEPHFKLELPMNETVNEFLCQGFSYTSPNGNSYSSGGTFYENFVGANGCPAVRKIILTLRTLPTKTENIFICEGASYNGYNNTGVYNYIKNGNNCDTVITLNLNVMDFDIITFNDNDINCKFDQSYIYAIIPNLPIGPTFDPVITYSWSSPDGNIISGATTDSILINKGGIYQLTMTFTGISSGIPYQCVVQSDWVSVFQTYDAPIAVVIPNGQLSCTSDEMLLDGGLSSPFQISYKWTTTGGSINGSNTGNFVSIDQPGTYLLTVTHDISGCTDTAAVKIKKNGFATTATLAKSSDIDCTNDTISLNAFISDTNFHHMAWTTADGNILTDPSTNKIFVNQAGEYFLTLFDDNDCESVISILVTEATGPPQVSAGTDKLLTCDNPASSVTGSVTTTSTNYTYQWQDANENIISENELLLNITGPGWYFFSAYDSLNNCSAKDSVLVNIDQNYPALSAIPDEDLSCNEITIDLNGNISNAGGNMVYTWSTLNGNFTGPQNTLNTEVDQTGLYQLIAKNVDNGCTDTVSVDIAGSIDQPDATAGPDVVLNCHNPFSGADGTYTSTDPATNITIAWTTVGGNIQGPTNGLNINVASPGLYIISVTNSINGCSDSDTLVVVKNDDKPVIDFENFAELTCLLTDLNIVPLWTNAGLNPTVTWQTIGGNIITVNPDSVIQIDKAGEYNLTIVNEETGCITTGGVIVTENTTKPDGSIMPPGELTCLITSTQITFTPDIPGTYDYAWTSIDGNITGSTNTPTVNATQEGTYEVEVTDAVNGCKNSFTVNVDISNDYPVVNAGQNDQLNCSIVTLTLNGNVQNSTDYTVSWQAISGGNIVSGGNTLDPVIDEAGIYILNIENNENGCKATDSIEVVANITTPEFLAPDIADADCLGKNGSIVFSDITNAQAPYVFKVNGTVTSAPDFIFDNLDAGSYTIEVTDANGCKSAYDANIAKGTEITMTLPDTLVLLYGQTYTGLFPLFEFDTLGMTLGNWTGATYLDCTHCINPVLTPTYTATLGFTVTNAQGCVASDEVYIRVRKKEGDFFIPNIFTPGDRNGINDFITVFTDSYSIPLIDEFRIFNRWGTEVFGKTNFSPNDESQGWNGYYKGSICNPGVYVYYARFKTVDGEPILAKGDLTLVK